jgi:hypothetical protein
MSVFIVVKSKLGKTGEGREEGMVPNLLPIVSTGNFRICVMIVVRSRAISDPGILWVIFGQKRIIRIVTAASPTARKLMVLTLCRYAFHLSRNQPHGSHLRPKKSFICEEKMMSAMPLVPRLMGGDELNDRSAGQTP